MILQLIVDGVIQHGLQPIGWAALEAITLGRYRGFRDQDIAIEGPIGLATIVVFCLLVYR